MKRQNQESKSNNFTKLERLIKVCVSLLIVVFISSFYVTNAEALIKGEARSYEIGCVKDGKKSCDSSVNITFTIN